MKKLLAQYIDLKAEIKDIEGRIERLRGTAEKLVRDVVTGSESEFPYSKRTFKITGFSLKKNMRIARLRKLLELRKEKCEEMQLQIEEFIINIPDSRTRRVFQYRYIDGMSWQAIAFKIGRHDESYPRKLVHDKYLEEVK